MKKLEVHLKRRGLNTVTLGYILAARVGWFQQDDSNRVYINDDGGLESQPTVGYTFYLDDDRMVNLVLGWIAQHISMEDETESTHILFATCDMKGLAFPIPQLKDSSVRETLDGIVMGEDVWPANPCKDVVVRQKAGLPMCQVNPGLRRVPVPRPADADEGKGTGYGGTRPNGRVKMDEACEAHHSAKLVN